MTTFEELVRQIQQEASEKLKVPVPVDSVNSSLAYAGITELLQSYSSRSVPRKLIVREVWFRGHKWDGSQKRQEPFFYQRKLSPGLNGWVAGNDKGKSTILKVILWAITGKEPHFKQDIRKWLEEVAVEIDMEGDGLFTIRFSLRPEEPKVVGGIYANDLETVLSNEQTLEPVTTFPNEMVMKNAIDDFFGSRMGYLPLESVELKKGSINLQEIKISWHIYSQALFIGAEDYSDYLFPLRELTGKHHQKTLSMILGLDFAQAVSKVQATYEKTKYEYEMEQKRLEANTTETREKAKRLELEILDYQEKLDQLESEESVFVDPEYELRLRHRVAELSQKVRELESAQRDMLDEEHGVKDKLEKAERTHQMLVESIQFKYFFSGISVERCPQCETQIQQEKIAAEIETRICRLCGNDVKPISSTDEQKILDVLVQQEIEEHKRILRKIRKRVAQLRKELKILESDQQKYWKEFNDLSRQERAGINPEIRRLESQLGYLQGQLDQLKDQSNVGQAEKLQGMKQKVVILQLAHQQLRQEVMNQHIDVIGSLERKATELAIRFGVANLAKVTLNDRFELIIHQSGSGQHFSRFDVGERLRMKIAFHLAMLTLRARDDLGRHPGLLFIDAPAGQEMDKWNFKEILDVLASIRSECGDKIQILIASTKEELIDLCGMDHVDNKQGSETLF